MLQLVVESPAQHALITLRILPRVAVGLDWVIALVVVPTPPSWLRTARALVVSVEVTVKITVNMLPVALDGKVVVTALPPAHTTVSCRQTAKLLVVLSKIATSTSATQSRLDHCQGLNS